MRASGRLPFLRMFCEPVRVRIDRRVPTGLEVRRTLRQPMDVLRCVFKHNVGWPRGFDPVPPHHASPVPMLESDDRGIGIRRVMATLPDPRNEGGFRCFEPDADERHRDLNRDTLDGLPVTGP